MKQASVFTLPNLGISRAFEFLEDRFFNKCGVVYVSYENFLSIINFKLQQGCEYTIEKKRKRKRKKNDEKSLKRMKENREGKEKDVDECLELKFNALCLVEFVHMYP